MTAETQSLGDDLALWILNASGIRDKLPDIKHYVVETIKDLEAEDDDLGTTHHSFIIISNSKLASTFLYSNNDHGNMFIAKYIKNNVVKADAYLENKIKLNIEFFVTYRYFYDAERELDIYFNIFFNDIRNDDFDLVGEVISENICEAELRGSLMWLMLQK
ncbi:hypothetical protein GV829_07275 [Sphingomonas lacunae]|uniref:Uncharacterized protein n=1 Tax=Sphingomonas lacunae TaxID=2698828 RepID=A0A6M4AU60_9SPHN|nr:hypothetical protein [Sphingomonas lacunae]QJQ32276.1 hypothetical protein GV829_07275 [Sphingomonas lacunae]